MTELLTGVEAPSDAELISRVRGGDVAAYGELFSRHVEAARRLGRQLVRGPDVDDLVSDAFAKTLSVLQNGGGPDVAFRAYLLTSLRRLHVDKIRAGKKVQPAEDMTLFDVGEPFRDTAVANFENGAAAKAFASLPERWQLVLWHLEVEGQKPADIAPLLGMTPNSVSALAYRAREGLRQAFLTMHLADTPTDQCRWVNEHLGAYVRKGLSKRDTTKVEDHLEGCRRCTAMYLELDEVNSNLAGIIAPLLLGAAAAGYLSSAGGAGATGVSALFGRARDAVSGNGTAGGAGATGSTAATAGGGAVTTGGLLTAGGIVAAGVAAITTAAFVFGGGAAKEVVTDADQPIGIVQTPAPGTDEEPEAAPLDETEETADTAEDPADEDVPLDAAVADGFFEPGGTTDQPTDFPAAPAFDADVVAPPAAPAPAAPAAPPAPAAPGNAAPAPPAPAPAPAQPGTDEPTTEDPAPPAVEQPGTNQPGTDSPPAQQPAPDNPPPAQNPDPTGPTDGEQPAPTPPDPQDPVDETPDVPPTTDPVPTPNTALRVSAFDVADGTASFTFDGASLDTAVRLSVSSEPAGIGIAEGGDCRLDSSGDGTWLCSPNGTATSPLARVIATAVAIQSSGYTIDVPLLIPEDQADRTTVTFDYLLDGEDAKPGTKTAELRIANVGLSVAPEQVTALDTDRLFSVQADVSGLPADATLDYTLTTSGATFVETGSCSTTDGGLGATCTSAGAGDLRLQVSDPTVDTPVSLVARPAAPFIDAHLSNNTATFTLPKADQSTDPADGDTVVDPPPPAEPTVSFGPVTDGSPYWTLSVTISDVPANASEPSFSLAGADKATLRSHVESGQDGVYELTIHMPPGQEPETIAVVVSVDDASYRSDTFTVGSLPRGGK